MIVGEGQDRRHFEALAQNLGIADRVHFLGWVEAHQVSNYMAASDVLVGPSKRAQDGWVEAQGLVFAEAMLAGVPVIATRSGGIPDLVQPQETGLLVDEGSPEQIAAAVRRIIQDPELTAQLTSQGRAHVRQGFTRSRTAEMFSNLLADLRQR